MKLSVSLPDKDVAFIDRYIAKHGEESRSAVIRKALDALLTDQLVDEYVEAFREWEASGEEEVWDTAAGDGLEDEQW